MAMVIGTIARLAACTLLGNDMHFTKSRAFTLVELLVVISVIAVLSTITFAFYENAQQKARDHKRKQDLQTIRSSLQQYYQDNNAYPATSGNTDAVLTTLVPTYAKSLPQDPSSGASYTYNYTAGTCPQDCYTLIACLENQKDVNRDTTKYASCTTQASYTISNPK